MGVESRSMIKDLNPKRIQSEGKFSAENRAEAVLAGNFLKTSGISDAVLDFRLGFLGEMGDLRNEFNFAKDDNKWAKASIVLEWIDPDDLRHLTLIVTAGCSDNKERFISASFKEIHHIKKPKHDPDTHEISILHLGKDFSFGSPVSKNGKMRYKKWLREKVLNYQHIWGEL